MSEFETIQFLIVKQNSGITVACTLLPNEYEKSDIIFEDVIPVKKQRGWHYRVIKKMEERFSAYRTRYNANETTVSFKFSAPKEEMKKYWLELKEEDELN